MQKFTKEYYPDEMHVTAAETTEKLQRKMDNVRLRMEERGFTETERRKIGRNEPCPCGSGDKFKKCCLNKAT